MGFRLIRGHEINHFGLLIFGNGDGPRVEAISVALEEANAHLVERPKRIPYLRKYATQLSAVIDDRCRSKEVLVLSLSLPESLAN
jgi:hypothetical protein